jgi:hypothetical protein
VKHSFPLVHPKDDGIRLAGEPDECFFCNQKVGKPHSEDCVSVTKKVRLRITIEIDVDEPYSFSPEDIVESVAEGGIDYIDLNDNTLVDCEFVDDIDPQPRRQIKTEEQQFGRWN